MIAIPFQARSGDQKNHRKQAISRTKDGNPLPAMGAIAETTQVRRIGGIRPIESRARPLLKSGADDANVSGWIVDSVGGDR
jgi:hypothetical protein